MSWILFTILNVITNGTAIFLLKRFTKKSPLDYVTIMFVALFFASLAYSPVFVFSFITNPILFTSFEGFLYFLLAVGIGTSAFYLYIQAISSNELSVLGPLDNLRPFFVVLFSLVLLHEKPTVFLLAGIFCVVIGAFVLTIRKNFFRFVESPLHLKETLLIVGSTALFGLESMFDKKALLFTDALKYSFYILLGMCIAFGVFNLTRKQKIKQKLFSWNLVIIGILLAIGYFGIISAVKLATPNLVTPVQMTRSLYVSFLGFVILQEKDYLRKIIAAILMLIGVVLIVQ